MDILALLGLEQRVNQAKKESPQERYARVDIDLGAAENVGKDIKIPISGTYLTKIKYEGTATGCYFKFGNKRSSIIYASEFKKRYTPLADFDAIYLTNKTAQTGKHFVLFVGNIITGEIESSPIIKIAQVKNVTIKKDDVTVTGNGNKTFTVVPSDKVWNIHSFSLGAYAGTYKHATVGIYDTATGIYLPLDTYTAIAAIRSTVLSHKIPLSAGMCLYAYIQDYSVSGLLWFRYVYDEEDAV